MSEINTQKILDGITRAISAEWPQSQIFDDEVEHGLKPGDFNVILVTSSQQQIVGERYKRTPLFDVLYYPKNGREDCYKVADTLSLLLNVISLAEGDLLRGTGLDFEVVDGVLHFYVRYTHFVRRSDTGDPMETLEIKQGG